MFTCPLNRLRFDFIHLQLSCEVFNMVKESDEERLWTDSIKSKFPGLDNHLKGRSMVKLILLTMMALFLVCTVLFIYVDLSMIDSGVKDLSSQIAELGEIPKLGKYN